MANLPEDGIWVEGVYQLETSDSVLAGPGGVSNRQAEELGNRTRYLKTQTDSLATSKLGILDAAASADKLTLSRNISVTGAATGSVGFDGSSDVSMALTLANSGVTAGTYGSATQVPALTVTNKGIITGVTLVDITGTGGDFIPTAEKGEPNGVAPLNGLGVVPSEFLPAPVLINGQCRFVYVSTTVCRLRPFGGNGLVINGVQYTIPGAGVDLAIANVGVANDNFAYVYAIDDGSGSIALEASATGHETHTDGIEIKQSDPTRTLVGVVYKDSGGLFVDTAVFAGVASWYNRYTRVAERTVTAFNTTSATPVAMADPISVWVWSDEKVYAEISGQFSQDNPGNVFAYLEREPFSYYRTIMGTIPDPGSTLPFSGSRIYPALEGMSSATALGNATGGEANFNIVFNLYARA